LLRVLSNEDTTRAKPATTSWRGLTRVGWGLHTQKSRPGVSYGSSACYAGNKLLKEEIAGVRRVRLSYDTGERTICLMPSQTQKGPAGPDIYRINRDAHGGSFIYCSTLHVVMPTGWYQCVEQTPAGYLCRHDPAKPAGKR
jgi:hypothetical protein